jgi:hypothetical protein
MEGGPLGQHDRGELETERSFHNLGGLPVNRRRPRRPSHEHHEGGLLAGLHELRSCLDGGEVECLGAARDQAQIWEARSLPRHGVGMGRRVDHGQLSA